MLALCLTAGSAALSLAETPDATAPNFASITLAGTGEVGSPLAYSIVWSGTPPYPSPTLFPQWLRDGEIIDGETGATFTPQPEDTEHAISVSIFASNASGDDSAVSNAKPIYFVAPSLTDPVISPSSGQTGDVFTVIYDASGTAITITLQWKINGTPIPGATGPTHQARPEDVGTLSCTVTVQNSGGIVEKTASPAASVSYVEAPQISNASIIPSSATVGQGLVVDFDVTGVPTPTVTFQWKRNGANVSGATSATFVPSLAGSYTCALTATNSEDSHQVETAAITVSDIPAGAPTLSGIPNQSLTASTGVQSLNLATYATGSGLAYTEIQTDNLGSLAALVVVEGVGGTRDGSTAFPFADPPTAFSYALTGPSPTFAVGSDPRGGITDADLPTGISINATTGLVTVSAAAVDMSVTTFNIWKYSASVVANQALNITVTDVPSDVWDITPGAETITVNDHPSVSAPTVSAGVETITRSA